MTRALLILIASLSLAPTVANAAPPRVLKFQGVPLSQGQNLKKKFPFVFEREVNLGEVDEIVRFLMKSGSFSNIEVVERDADDGQGRELVLVASVLRRVQEIQIKGNRAISTADVTRILNVTSGQSFERKNLVAAAEELRLAYQRLGYHNAKVEIAFDLPNEKEVLVTADISEGLPIKVSDAIVDSPNSNLNMRLLKLSRKLKDKVLTEELLLDFQRQAVEYFQENRFLTARLGQPTVTTNLEKTLAKVTYGVENPWKFEFRFEGNKFFSEGKIVNLLETEKLSGATSSPAPDMAERVRRMYEQAGFANVEVSYTEERNDEIYRHLIAFKIVENPRVRIKKIEITGNVSRPESYYTQFIKVSSSDLIGDGFYNRKDIEDGAKALIIELQNQGFLRAKIQSQRAEFSKDKTNATISFNIDEGPLTQVRQIRFDGVESFPRGIKRLSRMADRIWAVGGCNSVHELENPANQPRGLTGAALGFSDLTNSVATSTHLYMWGSATAGGQRLIKLDPATDSVTVIPISSTAYQIYDLDVSSTDEMTFSGLRLSDGAVVLGSIAADGTITVLDSTLEDSSVPIKRLN